MTLCEKNINRPNSNKQIALSNTSVQRKTAKHYRENGKLPPKRFSDHEHGFNQFIYLALFL